MRGRPPSTSAQEWRSSRRLLDRGESLTTIRKGVVEHIQGACAELTLVVLVDRHVLASFRVLRDEHEAVEGAFIMTMRPSRRLLGEGGVYRFVSGTGRHHRMGDREKFYMSQAQQLLQLGDAGLGGFGAGAPFATGSP